MLERLPGMTVELRVQKTEDVRDFFDNIFAGGGLVLSQVSGLTGLEPHVIQNWVRRGFLAPPRKKLYTVRQLCRILLINTLRESLQIEKIVGLLSYINGHLDDESDDQIDDRALYLYYVSVFLALDGSGDADRVRQAVEETVRAYAEPFPGGKQRLEKVLEAMVFAHYAAEFRRKAERVMDTFDEI